MHDMRNVGLSADGSEKCGGAPCYSMMIASDANDAHVCSWGEIFYYITSPEGSSASYHLIHRAIINKPFRDVETAPHPTSPKLVMTLCLRASQTSFAFGVESFMASG